MKAVIACAHKLLRIIYKILATHQEYDKEKVLGPEATVLTPKI